MSFRPRCILPGLVRSRQVERLAPWAGRGDGFGGRCFAPTSLCCSSRGRAAQLTSLAALASFRQCAASQMLRSALRAPTPGLRCSAPQTSPRPAHGASRSARPCGVTGPAGTCRSGNVSGVRAEKRRGAMGVCLCAPQRSWQRCGRCAAGAPCAQPRSAAAPAARAARAVHHSRGDCPSGARASERSEFRRASRCCEHRRAPPRSGGKHPARPRRTVRAIARADLRTQHHQRAAEQPT